MNKWNNLAKFCNCSSICGYFVVSGCCIYIRTTCVESTSRQHDTNNVLVSCFLQMWHLFLSHASEAVCWFLLTLCLINYYRKHILQNKRYICAVICPLWTFLSQNNLFLSFPTIWVFFLMLLCFFLCFIYPFSSLSFWKFLPCLTQFCADHSAHKRFNKH